MTSQLETAVNLETAKRDAREYLSNADPVFLWSSAGIGKSDLAREIAREDFGANITGNISTTTGYRDLRAGLLDSVDLRGLPQAQGDLVRWLIPNFLPQVDRDGARGLLHLDELNTAPLAVQAALYSLTLDRFIGEYQLPDGWQIIACGNYTTDRAAAGRMSTALANRFAHIDVKACPIAWNSWAVSNGIPPVVRAFMQYRGNQFLHKNPTDKDARAFPSPRSWARAARYAGSPIESRARLMRGWVGQEASTEFEAFAQLWANMPDFAAILRDPTGYRVPFLIGELFAVSVGLANLATRDNFAAVITYADRLAPEYRNVIATDAVKRDPGLAETAAFTSWAVRNQNVMN